MVFAGNQGMWGRSSVAACIEHLRHAAESSVQGGAGEVRATQQRGKLEKASVGEAWARASNEDETE